MTMTITMPMADAVGGMAFCILLFLMSFVENFATSIASCTVRLGAFRRVLTAISNLASSTALFFDMLGNSVY